MSKLPGHLTPTQAKIITGSLEQLRMLNDSQIIMLALAHIIDNMEEMLPELRIPMSITLKERAGQEFMLNHE